MFAEWIVNIAKIEINDNICVSAEDPIDIRAYLRYFSHPSR